MRSFCNSHALLFYVFIISLITPHGGYVDISVQQIKEVHVLIVCKYGQRKNWPPYVLSSSYRQHVWRILSPKEQTDFQCAVCVEDGEKIKYGQFVLYNDTSMPLGSIIHVTSEGEDKFCKWAVTTNSLSLFNIVSRKYYIFYEFGDDSDYVYVKEEGAGHRKKKEGPFSEEAAACRNFLSAQNYSQSNQLRV